MSKFQSIDKLEEHLATRSYVTGYALSEDDKAELLALTVFPTKASHPNVFRWSKHVIALTGLAITAGVTASAPAASTPAPAAAKNDDDMDLFGDDDDGETAEEKAATKARQERMCVK